MANASAESPVKDKKNSNPKKWEKEEEFLAMEFDPEKKYVFELAERNLPRELPVIDMNSRRALAHKPFIPHRNLVMTSAIIWKNQRRGIRYYDGCDTIFIDEQPKEKDVIQSYIAQTQPRNFVDGKLGIYGDERMLLLFMFASSFNGRSPFRTRTANVVYIPVDNVAKAKAEEVKLNLIEQALELAKNATDTKMLIHADFLGVSLEDEDSGNALTPQEIRVAYRLEASRDAKRFVESYGNKALETKYYIKKALLSGLIDTTTDRNNALWKTSGRKICDISGLQSFDAMLDRLLEFSLLEEGEEFKVQVEAIFNQAGHKNE